MERPRLTMELGPEVVYVDARLNDELTLVDLERVLKEVRQHYAFPIDVIWNRAGSYSVSLGVQKAAIEGIPEFRHFVYVVTDRKIRESAEFAVTTYMEAYHTQIAGSREEALALLSSMPRADLPIVRKWRIDHS